MLIRFQLNTFHTYQGIEATKLVVHLINKLPGLKKKRLQKLFTWRADNLITRAELIEYGKSEHIEEVKRNLDKLVTGKVTVEDLGIEKCCDIRNYLVTLLCIVNVLRCSNILNLRVKVSLSYFTNFSFQINFLLLKCQHQRYLLQQWQITACEYRI